MKKSNPKFLHIVGARPNFVKAFPLIKHLNDDDNITQVLVIQDSTMTMRCHSHFLIHLILRSLIIF